MKLVSARRLNNIQPEEGKTDEKVGSSFFLAIKKLRSSWTADSDASDQSGLIARRRADFIGDTSCPAGRKIKDCLKIRSNARHKNLRWIDEVEQLRVKGNNFVVKLMWYRR